MTSKNKNKAQNNLKSFFLKFQTVVKSSIEDLIHKWQNSKKNSNDPLKLQKLKYYMKHIG